MRYTYSAVFTPVPPHGLVAHFPDLPWCKTQGKDLSDAIRKSNELLCLCLYDLEIQDLQPPMPTPHEKINAPIESYTSPITVNTEVLHQRLSTKRMKKTIELPAWLMQKANDSQIDLAKLLQKSIRQELGLYSEANIHHNAPEEYQPPHSERNALPYVAISAILLLLALIGLFFLLRHYDLLNFLFN